MNSAGVKEVQIKELRAKAAQDAAQAATPAAEAATQESDMRTAVKSKPARAAPQASPPAKARPKAKPARANARTPAARTPAKVDIREGTKLATIVGLLGRPGGCTAAEILKATGWPSVSVPQQAKAAGLTLLKEKDGKVIRYRSA